MRISLNKEEIQQAIINYVGSQGISISGRRIAVCLETNGNDIRAGLEITDPEVSYEQTAQDVVPEYPDAQATEAPTPEKADESPEIDREAVKAELDQLGVEYAPKAHTSTLVTLLEEAKAAAKVKEDEPETQVPANQVPFEVDDAAGTTEPAAEPTQAAPEKIEEAPAEGKPDPAKSLFGNHAASPS